MEGNPAFDPIIGSELSEFHVEDWKLTFDFSVINSDSDDIMSYELQSISHICLRESDLFKPISQDRIMEREVLPEIYDMLEKDVTNFVPLGKARACRMDIGKSSLFFWANTTPPRALFYARAFGMVDGKYSQVKYWEIDHA